MLAGGEANDLVFVLEGEGEDAGVCRDYLLPGENRFRPSFGLEEDVAGGGGGGFGFAYAVRKDDAGSFVQGTDVVFCHHPFGVFGVCSCCVSTEL